VRGYRLSQEVTMERADWLDAGFDAAQARFLMVTAITHHRFTSHIWGELEVLKLYAELMEIEVTLLQAVGSVGQGQRGKRDPRPRGISHVLTRVEES
jgi:isocitrate dehydrogenase kinase/phosphatase